MHKRSTRCTMRRMSAAVRSGMWLISTLAVTLVLLGHPTAFGKSGLKTSAALKSRHARSGVLPPLAPRWDPERGVLSRVYAPHTGVLRGTPAQMARQYLSENSQLFGLLKDLGDLELDRVMESPSGYHVRLQQTYQEIPVYRSGVIVNLNRENRISSVFNEYKPYIDLQITVRISPQEALQIARDNLEPRGKLLGDPSSRLIVFPHGGDCYLAYRTIIPTEDPLGDWNTFVDAGTGEIIFQENQIVYYVNGSGYVFDPDPLTTAEADYGDPGFSDEDDADTPQLNAERVLVTLQDVTDNGDGTYSLIGPYCQLLDFETPADVFARPSQPDSFRFTRSEQGFEEVMVYYFMDQSQRYIQSLGFTTVQNVPIECDPHGVAGQDNSHYIPSQNRMAFGEGGVDDAEDADVILHEYGHAIQHGINPGWGGGHEDAMGEGFADYWAGSYSVSVSSFHSDWFANWDGHNPFWPGRVLNDTSLHYPEDVDGNIYRGGTLWASGLWDLFHRINDREVMDRLVLDHHFALGSGATMADAANEIIQSDVNLYGGAHVQAIVECFDRWGFVDKEAFLPTIVHTPLKDTEDTIGPYDVAATITSYKPLDPASLKLIYGTSGAFTDYLALEPTGGTDEYAAHIPGPLGSADVIYYLQAADTSGGLATHPAGAPGNYHLFHVGPDTIPPVISHTPMRDQAHIHWPAPELRCICTVLPSARWNVVYTLRKACT